MCGTQYPTTSDAGSRSVTPSSQPDHNVLPGEGDSMSERIESAAEVGEIAMDDQKRVIAPGVVDLLGVLAYGELSAFDRMSEDARSAPTLSGRAALSSMAAAEMGHYAMIEHFLADYGCDVEDAMRPFIAHFDTWHASTAPRSWLESLVKAYVGDGLAADLYREMAAWLDERTRHLVLEVLADTGHSAFAEREVRAAIERDPTVRDRLTLWGRRFRMGTHLVWVTPSGTALLS
jgi:hypothetical protein